MTIPQPKFSKGDRVFHVRTTVTTGRHECPDCFETGLWTTQSPAGATMEMDCPRCKRASNNNYDSLSLAFTKHVAYVQALTIGSIRLNTEDECPVSYMCVETGVGSGSVYYENQLFRDEADAQKEADRVAAQEQAQTDATPHATKTMERSRLGYFDALAKIAAEKIEARTRDRLRHQLEDFLPPGEHTPGVWVASGGADAQGIYHFEIQAQDLDRAYGGLTVCSGYGGLSSGFSTKEQGPANAALIAAAPELLAVAQLLASNDHPLAAQAKAAVAKAVLCE